MTFTPSPEQQQDWRPGEDRAGGSRGEGLRSPKRHAEYDRLRRTCPVAFSTEPVPHYTLTRFADVTTAARDTARLRSAAGNTPFIGIDLGEQIPITLNPPEHSAFRRLLNQYFRPRRMAALEPVLRSYAADHVDGIVAAGEADAVAAICRPFPAKSLAALLNLPDEVTGELIGDWHRMEQTGFDPDKFSEVMLGVFARHIGAVIAQRKAAPLDPETDLITGALEAEVDGVRLTDAQVHMIGVQIVAAGHLTSAEALGSAIHRLATDVELQSSLRAEPDLVAPFVEESIRLDLPLHEVGRVAAADVELHDRTIPAGCPVGLNFAAANRDPDAFPDPDAFVLGRKPNRHLGFGHGAHTCLGAPLARVELRVALEELLSRTSTIELAGETENDRGLIGGGFERVPIRVTGRVG